MRDTSGDMSDGRKWIKGKDGKLKGSISKSSAEGLTKGNKGVRITKREYNKVRKKINAQFYMYRQKKGNVIYSAELNAAYMFDIIKFDNYIITDKKLLE